MTTEEKLQNFYNHSLDSANREAERVIGDHQKALDKIFEEHKATARRQAEEEVAAEIEKAKRDVNKTCLRISFISDESCPVKIWN